MKRSYILIFLFLACTSFALGQERDPSSKILKSTKDDHGNPKSIIFKKDAAIGMEREEQLFSEYLKISKQDEMKLKSVTSDKLGFTHKKYQQYYNGVKVEFASYSLHAKNGQVQSMMGEYYKVKGVGTKPSIASGAALNKATSKIRAKSYVWQQQAQAKAMGYEKPKGELVILPELDGINGKTRLVYKFDVYSQEPLYRADVYVDAKSGEVVFENAKIHHTDAPATGNSLYNGNVSFTADYTGSVYRLRQAADGIETFDLNNGTNYNNASDITSGTSNFTSNDTGVQAHYAAEQTYKYFMQDHNRDSYDGNGSVLRSYISYSSNYVNAFWDGSRMTYGDGDGVNYGPLVTLDITGHEITHGVTEYSANLVYQRESGALNESFSDIFGELVEHFATGSNNWQMGTEIGIGGSGALRSMNNPNQYNDPDTYGGSYWTTPNCGVPTQSNDYCGVHSNSGVQNKWFYVLAAGESGTNDLGDSFSVTGLGMATAANIAYRNLTIYLSANSTFADARNGSIQSAIDLYGSGSAEEIATTNAWYAVGVGAEYVQDCILAAPNNLASSNINDNGFTLNWAAVSGASSYTVNVTGTPVVVSGTTYTATNLVAGTTYSVTVSADCSTGGTGATAGTNVTTTGTAPVNYCSSASTNVNDEFIGRVQLNTIDNASGAQFYSDFTSISTNLTKDNSYSITVTPTWTGTTYNESYSVWIDYNKDGDFTDSGEQVWTQGNTQTSPVSGSFTIPMSAMDGATRMRVSMKYNAMPTSCETFTYGEVEDYTVVIEGATPDTEAPTVPAGLAASSITQTSVDLSWNDSSDNVGVTGYTIYKDGSPLTTINGTNYQATGLTASTSYSFRVSAKDAANNESALSNSADITTMDEPQPDTEAPTAPTSLAATNVTQTTADLSWNASTDNVGVMDYTVYQDSSPIATVVSTNYQVSGLTAKTSYSFEVRANDEAGNESAGSNIVNIVTLENTGGGTDILLQSYFESGWDGWSDGGSDSYRYSGFRSYEGNYSIRLRDNTNSSTMTTGAYNLSGYNTVEVEFFFYPYSMENGEDFWLQFYNGSSWQTVAAYAAGTQFSNNSYYTTTVTISSANYNFANNSQFRFRCDASGNSDYVYIDQVTISGISGSGVSSMSIANLGSPQGFAGMAEDDEVEFDGEFIIYPNPVEDVINLRLQDNGNSTSYRIMNLLGNTVKSGTVNANTIEVYGLAKGVYVLELNDGEESVSEKFIKS